MTSQSSLNSHTDLQILTKADAVGNFVVLDISIVSSVLFYHSESMERRTGCVFRLWPALIKGTAEPVSAGPYPITSYC